MHKHAMRFLTGLAQVAQMQRAALLNSAVKALTLAS